MGQFIQSNNVPVLHLCLEVGASLWSIWIICSKQGSKTINGQPHLNGDYWCHAKNLYLHFKQAQKGDEKLYQDQAKNTHLQGLQFASIPPCLKKKNHHLINFPLFQEVCGKAALPSTAGDPLEIHQSI